MADLIYPSTGFWLEEEGYGDRLFLTKAIVRDRACALTIDYKNLINAASLEMVEKLDLTTTLHPHPYLLHWGPNNCGGPGLPPGIPVMHTIHDPRKTVMNPQNRVGITEYIIHYITSRIVLHGHLAEFKCHAGQVH
jgi:hypothetical protein